jgi:uncharacterized protein YjbI with pentapeptide repeats
MGIACKYRAPGAIEDCGRSLAAFDKNRCIFHSEEIVEKKAIFNDAFWIEFKMQEEQEKGYNFRGFVFPEDISFEEMEFDTDANFEHTGFYGKANFEDAHFSGQAKFFKAQFSMEANFKGAQFSVGANFYFSRFSGKAGFRSAEFFGEANFSHSHLSKRANFENTRFSMRADFHCTQFSGEVYFGAAIFYGGTTFKDADFKGNSNFQDVIFKDFNQCNMTNTSFYNVYDLLEYLAVNRKKIKRPIGIKYLHEKCKPILGDTTVSRLPILSREVRDDVYLMSFKEKHPRLHFLWWLFADCGRSIWRWAVWSLGFALTFAIIFNAYYQDYNLNFQSIYISPDHPFLSFLYYSFVTFTTLGFGDIVPNNGWIQFWVALEVIIGYVMLGGLISILANKLARRS